MFKSFISATAHGSNEQGKPLYSDTIESWLPLNQIKELAIKAHSLVKYENIYFPLFCTPGALRNLKPLGTEYSRIVERKDKFNWSSSSLHGTDVK